jgi:hypothetical protein
MWRARSQDEGSGEMQIPFTAYADDCTISGELAIRTDRLSDFLASTTEFDVASPSFRALDDGRTVTAESCAFERDDFCLVLATGPRGRAERRLWTRQHPVRYAAGEETIWTEAEAVLVNTAKIDHLETASEEDIGLARTVELNTAMDARAKDMTGA